MNPLSPKRTFYGLIAVSVVMSYFGETAAASTLIVGAVLFNALTER